MKVLRKSGLLLLAMIMTSNALEAQDISDYEGPSTPEQIVSKSDPMKEVLLGDLTREDLRYVYEYGMPFIWLVYLYALTAWANSLNPS